MRLSTKQIIGEAWEFTQNNRRLIYWYTLIPSLLTTLVGMLYLAYQYFAFISSPLFENWDQSFFMILISNGLQIVRDNLSSTVPIIIIAIIVGILYLLLPALFEGALIQIIARKRNNHQVKIGDGFRFGILSFLPLFEYSMFVKTFSFISIITSSAWILRNLGWDAFAALSPFIAIIAIVGIFLTILFTYSELFIVIDDRKLFDSVSKSAALVVTHLEETILLTILMIIISIRILVQIAFVLLIPAIMILIMYLIASATLPMIAFVVAGVVGLILLYIASYLSGTIHLFAASVWTFTFLKLSKADYLHARDKVEEPTE